MKNKNMKYIKAFNQEEVCLVISDYPEQSKTGRKNYGIAWYTKETLSQFVKKGKRFVVLAETVESDNRPKVYYDKKILVLRVFDQKHPALFPRILSWLLIFNKIKQVHVHSEFCANGGLVNLALLLPFLFLIKLTGKQITYFAHNVVTDLTPLSIHLNIQNSLMLDLLNTALRLYYRVLGLIVDHVVVLDEVIKKRISLFVNKKKVVSLPFWVEEKNGKLSKQKARAFLGLSPGDFVLLYFGFITNYKGADWLIHTVSSLQRKRRMKNLHLIMAGGEAYSLKNKPYYQKFYQHIVEKVNQEKRIKLTGFVPDNMIAYYFKAADLVIFPYRGVMGASGALNYALSYKKPFIISAAMQELIWDNEDFKAALQNQNLEASDISFTDKFMSFDNIIDRTKNSKNFLRKLQKVSLALAKERSFTKCVDDYYHKLFRYEKSAKSKIAAFRLSFRSS